MGRDEAPPRTLLSKVNSHLICVLCRGYYIDATTIVECLHTFCRSCIVSYLKRRSYCPVCEVMINTAKPNIKSDKALQDIVYKLVPGLFQREMAQRRAFWQSHPDEAVTVSPEQRGEDTERLVFSPNDVISFSLEYASAVPPATSSTSSSDSAGSGAETDEAAVSRRFLRCPAGVNISHLKKFLSSKFDIDSANFFVDILYKRVPLPDYYTLMDVAYIYNWKRVEPMRFFYQIADFEATRDRFGFVVTGKRNPPTEDPSRPLADPDDEDSGASRTPPPMTDAGSENSEQKPSDDKKAPVDVEKSQFLSSIELTATNSIAKPPDPPASEPEDKPVTSPTVKRLTPVKRKSASGEESDRKRVKIDEKPGPDKEKPRPKTTAPTSVLEDLLTQNSKPELKPGPPEKPPASVSESPTLPKLPAAIPISPNLKRPLPPPELKHKLEADANKKQKIPTIKMIPLKRKLNSVESHSSQSRLSHHRPSESKDTHAPNKMETKPDHAKSEVHTEHKNPPLKMNISIPKLNNSDSKSEPHIKRPTEAQKLMAIKHKKSESDNPLRSLFNINIPSSLSITLSEQKSDQKSDGVGEERAVESKKSPPSTNVTSNDRPSPPQSATPDKNCLEIIKLPDAENAKTDPPPRPTPPAKSTKNLDGVVTAKGPVPNLKPISEAKLSPISKPQTFQQTFLQSLQQHKDKPKYPKSRLVLPKVAPDGSDPNASRPSPGTPKLPSSPSLVPVHKLTAFAKNLKSDCVLDLSTPHPVQSQLGPQQAKALETMQSIDYLAKRNQNQRMLSPQIFSQDAFKLRPSTPGSLRIPNPVSNNQSKSNLSAHGGLPGSPKHFSEFYQSLQKQANARANENNSTPVSKSSQQSTSTSTLQSSERAQTRSPSSSPKLVIACPSPKSQSPEQKQFSSPRGQDGVSQSNTISSSQITSSNVPTSESSTSKDSVKPMKSLKPNVSKQNNVRNQSLTSNNPLIASSLADNAAGTQALQGFLQQSYIKHLQLVNPWFDPLTIDNIVKSMSNNSSSFGNNLNSKDK